MPYCKSLWYQHPHAIARTLLECSGDSEDWDDIHELIQAFFGLTSVLHGSMWNECVEWFVEYLSQIFVLEYLADEENEDERKEILRRLKHYEQYKVLMSDVEFAEQLFTIRAALTK